MSGRQAATAARFERLERQGHIAGYTIVRAGEDTADLVSALVLVYRQDRVRGGEVLAALKRIPLVVICEILSGDFDIVVGPEAASLERVRGIWEDIAQMPGVRDTDIGVDADTVAKLHTRIKNMGATTYLEVVSTHRDQALASVRTAAELGVDWLMGGAWIEETLHLLHGTSIGYLPFAGEPVGHPTRLAGDPGRIAEDCRRAEAAGCAGVDLLAYRATDADPLDLVRAARAATTGRLVVAGSITNTDQIRALASAGADAFTIGSAAFDGSLQPHAGTLRSQLAPVVGL